MLIDVTVGYADRENGRALTSDAVFPLFSISKSLTGVSVLQRVERGEVTLSTPIAEIIPEFGNRGKARATVAHLLSHTGGLTSGFPPVPPEQMGNLEAVVQAICEMPAERVPGEEASYAPLVAHAILAELVRRLDGGERRFRDVIRDTLLAPLGMQDTSLGMRADLRDRAVRPVMHDRTPGIFDQDASCAG